MSIFEELQQAIIDGKAPVAKEITDKGLREGVKPSEFFPKAIIPAMDEVGRRMRDCEFFIPEVLIAARAARAATDILRPLLLGDEALKAAGTVILGTVKGDLHDIGKNIVGMMLESAGFRIIDLGVDVPPGKIVDSLKEHNANFIALSALLTTTMVNMKAVVEAINAAGLRDKVKILVGGAPVTDAWAHSIGADGFGKDAPSAVELARKFVHVGEPFGEADDSAS
ncbi:MAG: corrinoid protein [Terriglobia bacterium]|jgi:5-methyltetrahydrofolate--homocysteine methyltransferase